MIFLFSKIEWFVVHRLLRGDYCLETDLVIDHDERKTKFNEHRESMTIPDDLLDALFECVEPEEEAGRQIHLPI